MNPTAAADNITKAFPIILMKKISIIYFILLFILICIAVITWLYYYEQRINNKISEYLKVVENIERGFIESFPIYKDYITPDKEKKLRKYLIKTHLKAAKKYGINPVKNEPIPR